MRERNRNTEQSKAQTELEKFIGFVTNPEIFTNCAWQSVVEDFFTKDRQDTDIFTFFYNSDGIDGFKALLISKIVQSINPNTRFITAKNYIKLLGYDPDPEVPTDLP